MHPKPEDTLRWINGSSGVETTVSVRNAIDYVYFVDGHRRIPDSVRDTVGDRLDDDPRYLSAQVNQPSSDLVGDDEETANDHSDLEALLDSIGRGNGGVSFPVSPRLTSTTPADPPTDQASHVKILAVIADDPSPVRFYLGLSQQQAAKRPAPHLEQQGAQGRRLESPSDLVDAVNDTDGCSKHVFVPSRTQRLINARIAAPDYTGKHPSAVVDTMILSRSTKFKPHAAIIARVYDIQFGLRGLSVMHFSQFGFVARRAWYAVGSVNLSNFSVAVAMPKAQKTQSLDDVSNALTVLHVFAEEFVDHHTCQLISSARAFVEELCGLGRLSAQDVGSLTFWFDRLLEDYRSATEADARHGTTTHMEIRQRLSLQNPDLHSVLYIIQSERLTFITATPLHATTTTSIVLPISQ